MKYLKSYRIFESIDIVSVSDTLQDLFDEYGILYSDKPVTYLHWRYGSYKPSSDRIVIKNIPSKIFKSIRKDIQNLIPTIKGRMGYTMRLSLDPPGEHGTTFQQDGTIILLFDEDKKVNEEVNPKDISFIQSLDDYFTVSFEFEIETQDKSNIKMDFGILYDDDVVHDITSIIKQELNLRDKADRNLVDDIIQSIINATDEGIISNEMLFDLLDPGNYNTIREVEIITFTKDILMSHISGEDIEYMMGKAKEFLPNFTSKWESKIDFVDDSTLDRGIEIKPKTYLNSISEGIEMINDFYSDLEKQDYWSFSSRTGLHVNIGVKNENVEWNPIKGLLMLNDFNRVEKPPLVFKDMTWRMNNNFCGSLIPAISGLDKQVLEYLKRSLDLNNLKSSEGILNTFLTDKIKEIGHKNFGFNITKLEHNYVEFRYVGGDIPKDVLIEKLKYFSFVVYTMTNPEYKKNEYLKKLYKFVDGL